MKMTLKNFILALILCTGCFTDDVFEQPVVVSITPAPECTAVFPDTSVVVVFSRSMDTVKTNEEFSLSSSTGRIDGYYSWDGSGKAMTFTPRSALPMAGKYTVRITKNAEDADGNDLKGEFLSFFYTGGDLGQPVVVSYTPAANSIGNPESCSVTVTFSEPVDMNSVYSGIVISPAVEGYFEASADPAEIVFTPLYGFSYGVTYKVSINVDVMDIAGNRLLAPEAFNFTVGDDFTRPLLAVYQNLATPLYFDESRIISGAEKDRSITIDFSEQVQTDNIASSVTISPSVPFYITTAVAADGGVTFTRGVINFTENLLCEETYTLRINSTVKDMQGNPLDHDYRFVFRTDGAGSVMPVVIGIGDIAADDSITYWEPAGDVITLSLRDNSGLYDNIGVAFSASINPNTLVINVETVAGNGGIPSAVNRDWPMSADNDFTMVKFGLYEVLHGNTYKIVIKGGKNGLKDSNGNYMKEDFIQIVRF